LETVAVNSMNSSKVEILPLFIPCYLLLYDVGSLLEEDEYRLSYKFLLRMVLSRCSDRAPR